MEFHKIPHEMCSLRLFNYPMPVAERSIRLTIHQVLFELISAMGERAELF
jgi:hypothetical protein